MVISKSKTRHQPLVFTTFLILITLFCRTSKAQQCPQGQKPSSSFPGKCISLNLQCDGYLFDDGSCSRSFQNTQASYQASVSYTITSVYCNPATGSDALKTVYICKSCPQSQPFRLGDQCVSCKSDEYQYFLDPVGCIKKSDFGIPKYRGYLTVDKTSIISECLVNQSYEEENVWNGNVLKVISQCISKCLSGTFLNQVKTKCIQCNMPGYVVSDNYCVLKPPSYQCPVIQFDQTAGAFFCKQSCSDDTYAISRDDSIICEKCPNSMPYYLNSTKSCVERCPDSMVYQQECSVGYNGLFGLVAKNGQVIIMQNLCTSNFSDQSNAFYVDYSYKVDGRYNLCRQCPDNTPFLNSSDPQRCVGCPDNQIFDYTARKCVLLQTINLTNFNVSLDKKAFFPKNYCPPGQYPSQNVCTPCSQNTKTSLNQQFCCGANQMFNEVQNKCENQNGTCKICMNGILLGDLNCVQQCPPDYIIQERTDSNSCFTNVPKQFQCIPCNKERQMVKNNICLSDCDTGYTYSRRLKKCILIDDCDGYFLNNNYKDCLVNIFTLLQGATSYITLKKGKYATEYIMCPNDKPFVEIQQPSNNAICTRCLDKIRDYETRRCVSSIDEISTPQKGTFLYRRLEYYPKAYYKLDSCKSQIAYFAYKSLGLKECSYEAQAGSCSGTNEIFDERTKNCVTPKMCSLILSSDDKICSLSPCKEDEISQVPQLGETDQTFSPQLNNYGYLQKCQLCPSDRPLKQGNESSCSSTCPAQKIINLRGTQCIDKLQCQQLISLDRSKCVSKCGKGEYARYDEAQKIQYCEKCSDSLPFVYKGNQCVKECPRQEQLIGSYLDLECIPKSQCKGFISIKETECLLQCPQNQFTNNSNQCLERCPQGLIPDFQTQQCILLNQCKNFISTSNECIQQCPSSQFTSNQQQGEYKINYCVDKCPDKTYSDPSSQSCKPWSTCTNYLSVEKDRCIFKCPLYQFESSMKEQGVSIKTCNLCSQNTDGKIYYDTYYLLCTSYCGNGIHPIIDLEKMACIYKSDCQGVISADKKYCEKSCSIGTSIISYKSSVPECTCPQDKPYIDFELKVCTNQCKIFGNVSSGFKSCLKDIQSCDQRLNKINEESYECIEKCPQIQERYCPNGKDGCIFMCKSCPIEAPIIHQNACYAQCPTPLTYYPDIKECVDERCSAAFEIFDIQQRKCVDVVQCSSNNLIVDLTNMKCVKECPNDYQFTPKDEQSLCLNKQQGRFLANGKNFPDLPDTRDTRIACIFSDPPGSFNSCQKEKNCNPPRIQIRVNDKILCVKNLTDYGYIFNKITSNTQQYYGIQPKQCNGFVSYDDQYCQYQCGKGEYIVNDARGFLKCAPCLFYLQFSKEKNEAECVQQCGEGYIANSNNICLPYQSECSGNKMISSDGLQCSEQCVFPDYNKDGKCTRWKSTDFNNACKTSNQVLDTTTLPPYKCIPKEQCSGIIIGQRCVIECNGSINVGCQNTASFNGNMNITQSSKWILDQIQMNEGIISIQTLNNAMMSLDWFAIQAADLLQLKKLEASVLLKSIKLLSQAIVANKFLLAIKDPYKNDCATYLFKLGNNSFPLPANNKQPWYCTFRNRLSPLKLNIQYQNLIFGRPDIIQVVHQTVYKAFQIKQLIDTTQYGQEDNSQISYNTRSADLNYQTNDKEIFIAHIKSNPFCKEDSQCQAYPLFYIDVNASNVTQQSIKFALKPDSPKAVCAYYSYSNGDGRVAYIKPGCLTEDFKFVICPISIQEAVISFYSLYEDKKDEYIKDQKVCSKESVVDKDSYTTSTATGTMTTPASFKEDKTSNKDINVGIAGNGKSYREICSEDGSDEGLSKVVIAIISICSFAFFQFIVFGVFMIFKRHKNNHTNDVINKKVENIPHLYAKTGTTTSLKEEEIESQQPQTTNSIKSQTQI